MENKVYIIAEIGINHNGDMNIARSLMHKAQEAGCDAVKFQKRDVDSVYSQEELNSPRESPWGKTTRQQKEGLEFSIDQYRSLSKLAQELNLDFGVSCWDCKSLSLMEENVHLDFHKVASALLTHKEFLTELKKTNKRVLISTGMSTTEQIESAINLLGGKVDTIMACTSTYPTKPSEVNLRYVKTLRDLYYPLNTTHVGFSNHYNGHDACVGAVAMGADVVEFHITLDRAMYGSDQSASIENVKQLVDGIRMMELMLGTGEKTVFESELPIAKKLRKVTNT